MRNFKRSRGFALVVTLSLMILLTIIAVELLSLSAIAPRQSAVNSPNFRRTPGMVFFIPNPDKSLGAVAFKFIPETRIATEGGAE